MFRLLTLVLVTVFFVTSTAQAQIERLTPKEPIIDRLAVAYKALRTVALSEAGQQYFKRCKGWSSRIDKDSLPSECVTGEGKMARIAHQWSLYCNLFVARIEESDSSTPWVKIIQWQLERDNEDLAECERWGRIVSVYGPKSK